MDSALNDSVKKDKTTNCCLNCGSKLRGNYCHNCGQQVSNSSLTVRGFVMEYIFNAFMWDPKFFKTLWLLVRKPGALTKDFMAGKYVSQVHPLKLNMFMLFVFITMFLFFSGTETANDSVHTITNDERVTSALQMGMIVYDEEYLEKIKSSPRDTVHLNAPLILAEEYPHIITRVSTIKDTQGEALDKWIAVIPRVLIEEGIVLPDTDGYYHFKEEVKAAEMVEDIWAQMVEFTTRYFPLIVLFTAPFLSFSLRLVQHKEKRSSMDRFIFALHYTAFLELSIILIYLLHLIASPSVKALQLFLVAASCVYLTLAFRRVYGIASWFKAGAKALCTSIIYFMIIIMVFITIIISAIFAILPGV